MKKYIDAEKLIELLEEMKRAEYENCGGVNSKTGALQEIQELIDSLQQEQPEKTLTFGGFVDKVGTWFAHLRLDKFRKTFDGETFPATELVQRYDLFVRELEKQYSDKQEQLAVTTKGWVAKDYNGAIRLFFLCKPQRIVDKRYKYWYSGPNASKQLPNDSFPDLKWEDEPIEVTLLIKE